MGDAPTMSTSGGFKQSTFMWPMLNGTNYVEWAMMM
jgi:hypothetical protein